MLDGAQRVLLAAVPTSRDEGTPLAEALGAFLDGLARAEEAMPAWRDHRTEAIWHRCAEALVASRAAAEQLRDPSLQLGFEALNVRLGEVISPLEEFADAASELRRIR